jgi:hypothetical protein
MIFNLLGLMGLLCSLVGAIVYVIGNLDGLEFDLKREIAFTLVPLFSLLNFFIAYSFYFRGMVSFFARIEWFVFYYSYLSAALAT